MTINPPEFSDDAFYGGQVLLIHKDLKWTSFDVVNKMKILITNAFGKKIKIGHAGTLDPLATGLLIVCTGKATKQIEQYQGMEKTYKAAVKLGSTTASYDLETEEQNFKPVDHITPDQIRSVLESFKGQSEQSPPIFSAKKINGKKAYELARKGEEAKLKKSVIQIYDIQLISIEEKTIYIEVCCSKGTYIRSLAHDIGQKLGCGAHLCGLERTAIGNFSINEAITISEFEKKLSLRKLS